MQSVKIRIVLVRNVDPDLIPFAKLIHYINTPS
jgi:hypothetical protein